MIRKEASRCSLQKITRSLFTRCKKITCYSLQNLLVTRCKIGWLLVAEVAHPKKSLVSRCEIPSILIAKNNSSLK